ncbi:hypothetical protein [Huaxiibacter chinensis]
MSNIDKQALREKFEAWWEVNYHNGNPPRFGWEHWRDGDGYKIDDDESELDGMWESWQAAHSSKLEDLEELVELQRFKLERQAEDLHQAKSLESIHREKRYEAKREFSSYKERADSNTMRRAKEVCHLEEALQAAGIRIDVED